MDLEDWAASEDLAEGIDSHPGLEMLTHSLLEADFRLEAALLSAVDSRLGTWGSSNRQEADRTEVLADFGHPKHGLAVEWGASLFGFESIPWSVSLGHSSPRKRERRIRRSLFFCCLDSGNWRGRAGGGITRDEQEEEHEDDEKHHCPASISAEYSVHMQSLLDEILVRGTL